MTNVYVKNGYWRQGANMTMPGDSEMMIASIIMLIAAIIMFLAVAWGSIVALKRKFCCCSGCGQNQSECKCGH